MFKNQITKISHKDTFVNINYFKQLNQSIDA